MLIFSKACRLVVGEHACLGIFSKCCRLVVGKHTCLGIFSKCCWLVEGGHTCLGIYSKWCRLVVGGYTCLENFSKRRPRVVVGPTLGWLRIFQVFTTRVRRTYCPNGSCIRGIFAAAPTEMISAFPKTWINPYCLVVDDCWDSPPPTVQSSGARSALLATRFRLGSRPFIWNVRRTRDWEEDWAVLNTTNWFTLIATSRTASFRRALWGTRITLPVPWLILPVGICLSQTVRHVCLSERHINVEPQNGSLHQVWFLRWWTVTWIPVVILKLIHANIFRTFRHTCLAGQHSGIRIPRRPM